MFDEDRYNSIVATHNTELFKYCLDRLSHDFGSAEEATNDVFVVLYKKWNTLDFTEIRAWLYRTADKIILHYWRKKPRIKETPIDDFTDKNLPVELVTLEYEEGLMSNDYVSSILNKLDKKERKLYQYRYVEGMSFAKISEVSGIPKSTVIFRINQIKRKLQEYIQGEG